jgi:hypothetical protein
MLPVWPNGPMRSAAICWAKAARNRQPDHTGGFRFALGPGCTVGTTAPEGGHGPHEEPNREFLRVLVDGPSTSRGTERSKRSLAREEEDLMRKRIAPFAMALLLVVVGCSSSDPTTSDEYAALEQELAQSEAQLADVTAERDALVKPAEATAAVLQESNSAAVPDDVAALMVAWGEAINTGGGAVTELYTAGGSHLDGSTRIAHGQIAAHLEAPSTEGVWVTDPYLLIDEGNGRYVVARGSHAAGAFPGSITFLIVRAPDGELEIAETAWVHAGEA